MITNLDQVREGKLCWPDHKPRTAYRQRAQFSKGLDSSLQEIKWEMERWRAVDYVISRNNQRVYAGDPAVALWWTQKRRDGTFDLRVLACDKWDNIGHNAHAIALTLSAMRALERWGAYTAEQAAQGARAALPPPADQATLDWKAVLGAVPAGITGDDALAIVNARYRRMSADAQGNEDEQRRLNLAIEAARAEFKP
ncbi:MAG TPA: hypothetical protein VG328_05620 [Stellaceae bacterium]|jgi:hypothetical protein|nr:hypothetical protein [Stellaceae bacterium]